MPTEPSRILIRVEAGPGIGLGHVTRCLSIGQALAERGADWQVLAHDRPAVAAVVGPERTVALHCTPWSDEEAESIARLAARTHARFAIVDSYQATARYLSLLRDRGVRVAVIQDTTILVPCDLLLNAAADAAPLGTNDGPTFLRGPAFVPLRREFWQQTRRDTSLVPHRVLITLGGSDPRRLSSRLLERALEILGPQLSISCIAGPFFGDTRELKEITSRASGRAEVIDSPTAIASRFRDADVAIAGGGQTLYELATVGTPTVGVVMAENQRGQLEALARGGVVRLAGCADAQGIIAQCMSAVSEVLGDYAAREAMAGRGQALVDGQGAMRVTEALLTAAARS